MDSQHENGEHFGEQVSPRPRAAPALAQAAALRHADAGAPQRKNPPRARNDQTMKNTLEYKGYTASVHFDAEGGVFYGNVDGIRISFHADNMAQLTKEFADSIDFYLENCAHRGEKPKHPATPN